MEFSAHPAEEVLKVVDDICARHGLVRGSDYDSPHAYATPKSGIKEFFWVHPDMCAFGGGFKDYIVRLWGNSPSVCTRAQIKFHNPSDPMSMYISIEAAGPTTDEENLEWGIDHILEIMINLRKRIKSTQQQWRHAEIMDAANEYQTE